MVETGLRDVDGTVTATALAGALTGNVAGNLTSSGANTMGTLVMSGNITSQNIIPAANTTYDLGSSSLGYNVVYAKATSAQYADLAEVYESDDTYDVGTVVIFGGDKEITLSKFSQDTRVAGVISENPAYLMNDKSAGQSVALVGKVPVKVHGMIAKGDLLTTCGEHPGCAKKAMDPKTGTIIGKALENYNSTEVGRIFVSVGKL